MFGFCSICVDLSILAEDAGLYGKDVPQWKKAITQVNGTVLCLEHAKPFFKKMREEQKNNEKLFESLDKL